MRTAHVQFITAAAPNFDAPGTNTNQEAYRLQLKMFLGLIAQQQHLPPLKQLLQLYTVRAGARVARLNLGRPSYAARTVSTASKSAAATADGESHAHRVACSAALACQVEQT